MARSVLSKLALETQGNPLTKNFWQSAAAEFHNLRTLTTVSLLLAVTIIISNFFIPLGDNLKVFFTFLPKAVYCAIGGPLVGMAAGFAGDIIGYLMHPDGGYFFGYTLSSMLGCFIYGLFFYRTKVTLPRIIVAKVLVNYLVNVALGCLWSSMMVGQAYLYYLGKSLLKNTLLLPVEIFILSAVFASLHVMGKRSK